MNRLTVSVVLSQELKQKILILEFSCCVQTWCWHVWHLHGDLRQLHRFL